MSKLRVSVGITENPRTAPLIAGTTTVKGADLSITTFKGGSELFWRQLKFGDFEVSEMSLSTLLILASNARSKGELSPWVGIPVFTSRMYFHLAVLVRTDRSIQEPQDLHGKRVGVPEYQQTAAVWTRGVLMDDFGFDPTKVEWYMERVPEISHAGITGYEPPPGVVLNRVPHNENLGTKLLDGSLDAALRYLRNDNLVDRSRVAFDDDELVRPMFNAQEEAARFHQKHGLFPINHGIAIKRQLAERYPWLVLNIFNAFSEARDSVDQAGRAFVGDYTQAGLISQESADVLGKSRFRYGISGNLGELTTLCRYAHEQGMTTELLTPEDIFDEHTWSL